ncbi:hypothetical protein [Thalassospira permensis]|uniref:Uncharacterized protein n=1 Tax=Thalassospira permensis NBRC 106175 TaxID=1353532 RepID=A0ABR4TKS9_9PROT|nr:hypothetical protein [Thalassospira permensis]KEO53764.1 hypothetical protein SMB34_06830 [Thalassospira permensis NBRC 106175]
MNLENARNEVVAGWGGTQAAKLCMRILDYIAEANFQELRMLTFRQLCNASKLDAVNEDLIAALAILTSEKVDVLKSGALFVDIDETEYELSSEELRQIQLYGTFIHPDTGEAVDEIEARVFPFFAPSDKLALSL